MYCLTDLEGRKGLQLQNADLGAQYQVQHLQKVHLFDSGPLRNYLLPPRRQGHSGRTSADAEQQKAIYQRLHEARRPLRFLPTKHLFTRPPRVFPLGRALS